MICDSTMEFTFLDARQSGYDANPNPTMIGNRLEFTELELEYQERAKLAPCKLKLILALAPYGSWSA